VLGPPDRPFHTLRGHPDDACGSRRRGAGAGDCKPETTDSRRSTDDATRDFRRRSRTCMPLFTASKRTAMAPRSGTMGRLCESRAPRCYAPSGSAPSFEQPAPSMPGALTPTGDRARAHTVDTRPFRDELLKHRAARGAGTRLAARFTVDPRGAWPAASSALRRERPPARPGLPRPGRRRAPGRVRHPGRGVAPRQLPPGGFRDPRGPAEPPAQLLPGAAQARRP